MQHGNHSMTSLVWGPGKQQTLWVNRWGFHTDAFMLHRRKSSTPTTYHCLLAAVISILPHSGAWFGVSCCLCGLLLIWCQGFRPVLQLDSCSFIRGVLSVARGDKLKLHHQAFLLTSTHKPSPQATMASCSAPKQGSYSNSGLFSSLFTGPVSLDLEAKYKITE